MKSLLGFLPIALSLPALELKKQRIGFQWNLKNVSRIIIQSLRADKTSK